MRRKARHFNLEAYNNRTIFRIHQDPGNKDFPKEIVIRRVDRMIKKPLLVIHLQNTLKQGTVAELEIDFNGQIWESSVGMFKGTYPDVSGEKKYEKSKNK
jgi:Peptidase M1 N-terminal domain